MSQSEAFLAVEHALDALSAALAHLETENAELRKLATEMYENVQSDDATFRHLRAIEEQSFDHFISVYDSSLGTVDCAPKYAERMHKLVWGMEK